MKWTAHTDMLSNTLSKLNGILNKLKAYLPLETLKILHNSLFSFTFETKRIFKLQKRPLELSPAAIILLILSLYLNF